MSRYLSHALKNTANQRHILRYPTGSIPPSFPAITCELLSKWRQNCVRTFPEWRQSCRTTSWEFLIYKVKIVLLEAWEVNKKLIKNAQIFPCSFKAWDKLVMQCFLMGSRGNASLTLALVTCIFHMYTHEPLGWLVSVKWIKSCKVLAIWRFYNWLSTGQNFSREAERFLFLSTVDPLGAAWNLNLISSTFPTSGNCRSSVHTCVNNKKTR